MNCFTISAGLILTVLVFFNSAIAAEFSFQPRLEAGIMQYSFESGALGATLASQPVNSNSGFNYTQKSFEYSDTMLVIGGGGTFFLDRLFLDVSGQSAVDGNDSALASFSAFYSGYEADEPLPIFFSAEPRYEASFDRTDIAISLGYAFSRHLSVFAGYKRAKTEFDATFQGPLNLVVHDETGTIPFDKLGGSIRGDTKFNFEYDGPFIGAVQGWDFGQDYYLTGVLTASLALAYLEGDVEVEERNSELSISSIDGQPVPDTPIGTMDRGFTNRFNTSGETLGYTIGIGWHGTTPVEGFSYSLNISGYRYEFDTDDNTQSDINETAIVYKAGLSYAF